MTRKALIAGIACFAVFLGLSVSPSAADDVPPSLDRGSFGPFLRSLNVRDYGYRLAKDPISKMPGQMVERFEVRNGDCHFNGGWSDCDRDRERSELWEQGRRSPLGTEAWYGWRFYLPADWPNVWPAKTVLGQFHQVGAHPVWMFLHRGGLVLDDQSTGRTKQFVELIPESQLRGRWHRIEVHARWRPDAGGFFNVYVNGVQKFRWAGPTMTSRTVYFRYGIYRSFVSRYRNHKDGAALPTQSAFFSNVKMAKTRAGLR